MKSPLSSFLLCLFLLTFYGAAESAQRTGQRPGGIPSRIPEEPLSQIEVKALEAEKNNQWYDAAQFYNQASFAARAGGQLQKAATYASKALELGEKVNAAELQVHAILNLAFAYRLLGQTAKAEELLRRGIEITKKIPSRLFKEANEGNVYRDLGFILLRQRKHEEAIKYLSYALQVQESRLSFFRSRRAFVRPQAIESAELLVALALNRLGNAYERAGNIEGAIQAYEKGIALLKQSKTQQTGLLYSGLGTAYLRQKDFPRAEENLNRALEIAEELRLAQVIEMASSALGDLYLQTKKPEQAISYYKKAIDSIESTRSLLESEEYRSSYFENKRPIYEGMILAHLQAENLADAFSYGERARSRAFLDILGSKVQLSRGTLLEHERALQARIAVLRSLIGEEEGDSPGPRDLRLELEGAQRAYEEFLTQVRKESREQASLMSVEPLTLKQVQDFLEPGVTMLEYFVTQQEVLLWVVEKDAVRFESIRLSRGELVSKVTSLRESIFQVGEKERFQASSQELYKRLIEPALPHIRGKELIVVPHDVLHYLPFNALLSSDGRYLIEKYPIYYLSSASLLQFTKEKRRAMGEKVLALGNPDLGDPQMNLRFAELEAKEVQGLYPQSTVLLKKEATEEKAKALSPQNDILHFASHAELSEEDPLSSAILLTKGGNEDGRLEVREIFGMDLKADLVVLSACETGLGKLSSGDELVGLTRAFIYAGTPSVVASLWNVEDSSTAQLMASFYRNLRTMSKVEALRQAQLQLIRGEGSSELLARRGVGGIGKLGEVPEAKPASPSSIAVSTSHPYFWAPFILVGDGK